MPYSANGFLLHLGMDTPEVLSFREGLKAAVEKKQGATVVGWTANGVSVTKEFPLSLPALAAECQYALERLDPATFGERGICVPPHTTPRFG